MHHGLVLVDLPRPCQRQREHAGDGQPLPDARSRRRTAAAGSPRSSSAFPSVRSIHSMRLRLLEAKTATGDPSDRQRVEIDAVQAPHVHRPAVERLHAVAERLPRRSARTPERQDAAARAEVVLRVREPH